MSQIIDATYRFLDSLDNSELITNLTKYKNKLLKDKSLLKEISKIKNISDSKTIIEKRKHIYDNNDYKMYMHYYQELSFVILKINKKYASYTSTREHDCHE